MFLLITILFGKLSIFQEKVRLSSFLLVKGFTKQQSQQKVQKHDKQFSRLSVEIHTENNLFRQELKDIKKANILLLCTVHLLPTVQDQMNTETGMKYYNSSIIIDDTVHSVSGSYHFGPHGEWENFGNQI